MLRKQDIHPIQGEILKSLLFVPEARFSELNIQNIGTDHFTFHIKRLIDLGLIEKNEEGLYRLTITGKEFANRFDVDGRDVAIEKQAKISVLIACVTGKGENAKYLVYQRLKQPYYGMHGFMTGKIKWGETIFEAACRELNEETNLEADLSLAAVKHKMEYAEDGKLLEDKYFYLIRGENPRGELLTDFKGGKNMWLTEKGILELPDLFDDVRETLNILKQGKFIFSERKWIVSKY